MMLENTSPNASAAGLGKGEKQRAKGVREVQKELVKDMLGLEPDSTLIWKVLVYDDVGRQIISPLLRLSELKELGVTIHL